MKIRWLQCNLTQEKWFVALSKWALSIWARPFVECPEKARSTCICLPTRRQRVVYRARSENHKNSGEAVCCGSRVFATHFKLSLSLSLSQGTLSLLYLAVNCFWQRLVVCSIFELKISLKFGLLSFCVVISRFVECLLELYIHL